MLPATEKPANLQRPASWKNVEHRSTDSSLKIAVALQEGGGGGWHLKHLDVARGLV